MGYCIAMGACVACKAPITFNPASVPSIRVNGHKEPVCRACFSRWNQIHRVSKGLPPVALLPDAYGPCDEANI